MLPVPVSIGIVIQHQVPFRLGKLTQQQE